MVTIAASFIFASLLANVEPACRIAQAVFEDRSGAGYSLQFANGGAATLTSTRSGAVYHFDIVSGEGYSTTHLQPRVQGSRQIPATPVYGLQTDLDVVKEFPSGTDPAPRYVFAPELGQMLWYHAEALGGPRWRASGKNCLEPYSSSSDVTRGEAHSPPSVVGEERRPLHPFGAPLPIGLGRKAWGLLPVA